MMTTDRREITLTSCLLAWQMPGCQPVLELERLVEEQGLHKSSCHNLSLGEIVSLSV